MEAISIFLGLFTTEVNLGLKSLTLVPWIAWCILLIGILEVRDFFIGDNNEDDEYFKYDGVFN